LSMWLGWGSVQDFGRKRPFGTPRRRRKTTLNWITGRYVVRIGRGWNWFRIVFNVGLWYYRCWIFGFCYQCLS